MKKSTQEEWSTRNITTPEGVKITFFDNKFHNWNGPAIKYPRSENKPDEYYLYGFEYDKETWLEFRRDRNGVAPDKNPQVQSRF